MRTRDVESARPLPGYPRPLWLETGYLYGRRTRGCLRCQASLDGTTEAEAFDFELLHSLCPAPRRQPTPTPTPPATL